MRRWGLTHSPGRKDTSDSDKTRDLILALVEDRRDEDAYDVFVDHISTISDNLLSAPAGRGILAAYFQEHAYPEMAAYVRSLGCDRSLSRPLDWHAFPGDFQSARAELEAQVKQQADPDCAQEGTASDEEAGLHTQVEHPLPPRLRWRGSRPESAVIPARAKKALSIFRIVRYSGTGDQVAAISLSQAVNPVGEISGGGYWLHLSPDGGRTWRSPLYLGLQQFEPYEVVTVSHLPLIRGRKLQLEVIVKELGPQSITFPPIDLRTKRKARDLFIEMSLDDIERDSDDDGVTDLLEERLQTNPHDRDTDHDGLVDGLDPLPQVSIKAAASMDPDVLRLTLQNIFGYASDAILTGGPRDPDKPLSLDDMFAHLQDHPAETLSSVLFLQSDRTLFQGVTVPGRSSF